MMVLIFDDTKNRRHTQKKDYSVGLERSDWVVEYSRQQYSATTFGSSRIIIGSLIIVQY